MLITHNPHHAYMVGDEFVLLKRGGLPSTAGVTMGPIRRIMDS